MSLITVDTAATEPPFEQVRRQIATHVVRGTLSAGEKLPTVRQLASDLGLAANTVARAYRELEADDVIATHGRRGTFVRSEIVDAGGGQATTADSAAAYTAQARRQGLSLAEALRLVESAWAR